MTTTREQWLGKAVAALTPMIEAAGHKMPAKFAISCGWPSRGGLARKKKTIGQCWDSDCSKNKTWEMFISPVLHDVVDVLAVTLHEMIHAAVGLKCGHKGAFKQCATACGLEGKMTATVPGKELTDKLKRMAEKLGEYPHSEFNGRHNSGSPKQGTRLLKVVCVGCEMVIRTTQKWIDETGLPTCACGSEFIEEP